MVFVSLRSRPLTSADFTRIASLCLASAPRQTIMRPTVLLKVSTRLLKMRPTESSRPANNVDKILQWRMLPKPKAKGRQLTDLHLIRPHLLPAVLVQHDKKTTSQAWERPGGSTITFLACSCGKRSSTQK